MENKKTQKDLYVEILGLNEIQANQELRDFIAHQIDQIEKKAKTRKSISNPVKEALMAEILEVLPNYELPVTIATLQKDNEALAVTKYTNQRVTAAMTALVKAGKVEKVEGDKKGKGAYKIA